MPRGQPHDPAFKAQVLAALATGETVSSVARHFGISRTTVSMWRDAAGMNETTAVVQEKHAELGKLIVAYMVETIETLTAHMRLARDEEWFKRQSARDIAIFCGVSFDKLAYLLEAQQRYECERQAQTLQGEVVYDNNGYDEV